MNEKNFKQCLDNLSDEEKKTFESVINKLEEYNSILLSNEELKNILLGKKVENEKEGIKKIKDLISVLNSSIKTLGESSDFLISSVASDKKIYKT